MKLSVIVADITTLKVDVIANAATTSLLGGSGVDGAIHRAAGPRLLQHCRTFLRCDPGQAVISPGFDLPAKWCIHCVGPVWWGGNQGEARLLASCYDKAMDLATTAGCQQIAFPCISTGVYGYPSALACRVAVNAVRAWESRTSSVNEVIFCCFGESDAALYREALK